MSSLMQRNAAVRAAWLTLVLASGACSMDLSLSRATVALADGNAGRPSTVRAERGRSDDAGCRDRIARAHT